MRKLEKFVDIKKLTNNINLKTVDLIILILAFLLSANIIGYFYTITNSRSYLLYLIIELFILFVLDSTFINIYKKDEDIKLPIRNIILSSLFKFIISLIVLFIFRLLGIILSIKFLVYEYIVYFLLLCLLNIVLYLWINRKARLSDKSKEVIKLILIGLVLYIGIFLIILLNWLFTNWTNLRMDELVYTMNTLQGTGSDQLNIFINMVGIPSLVILIILVLFLLLVYPRLDKAYKKLIKVSSLIIGLVFIVLGLTYFEVKMKAIDYLIKLNEGSSFVEENYVNPSDVEVTFPENKRNLIYIYLESMETSYSDIGDGGGKEVDVIPELTKLAKENEDFSGEEDFLNGGYVTTGAGWTMGALFGQTSSLPLLISIDGNDMETQDAFFPNIITLGDVLYENGYTNVFACGSDGSFGGRSLYFESHGDYDIRDYNYRINNGDLDESYYVYWGFEDAKLLEYAKKDILELANSDKPFNYTMLTVDTHFEDGYLCDFCEDIYGEQYANVMACSSRQIYEFINWCKSQDFYENTTIILSGDHLTMDSDFCDDLIEDYDRRNYVAIINGNPIENNSEGHRQYTTLDMFPTTLASLGVSIDGDRLGLGTNLYSGRQTLVEEYSKPYLDSELSKSYNFVSSLSGVDENSAELIKKEGKYPMASVYVDAYDEESGLLSITIKDIFNLTNTLDYIDVSTKDGDDIAVYNNDGTYSIDLYVSDKNNIHLSINAMGHNELNEETIDNLYLYDGSIDGLINQYESGTSLIDVRWGFFTNNLEVSLKDISVEGEYDEVFAVIYDRSIPEYKEEVNLSLKDGVYTSEIDLDKKDRSNIVIHFYVSKDYKNINIGSYRFD